jgi:hypothetical protein
VTGTDSPDPQVVGYFTGKFQLASETVAWPGPASHSTSHEASGTYIFFRHYFSSFVTLFSAGSRFFLNEDGRIMGNRLWKLHYLF